MKIAILADAHGNQYGFHAALEDAKKKQADLIVSAGDMLASFPGGPELASPIGWLELSQIITAQPLMKYYFRDRFNADKGTDVKHLSQTVRDLLDEYDALDRVEAAFGPLVSY